MRKINKIPERVALYILKEITKGICYIHKQNQIHRDIKSENIFIDDNGNIKIGDFGNSVQLTEENPLRSTLAGSPLWLSPEVATGSLYSFPSDIWSLGIIAYELVEGRPPHFNSRSFADLAEAITKGDPPQIDERKAPDISSIFGLCFMKDPELRITAQGLLDKPEFNEDYDDAKELIALNIKTLLL